MAQSLFDQALALEGTSPAVAKLARSIYQQESGSGSNTTTSNAGAVGGMQILGSTFKDVADKDWDINDPLQNARAGIRYLQQGYQASGGNAALAGAYYYGGPGGMEKARQGIAVSDPRNPKAPTTLEYGAQVAARAGMADQIDPIAPPLPRPDGWPVLPTARSQRASALEKAPADTSVLDASNQQAVQMAATAPQSEQQTQDKVATDEALQARKDATGFGTVFQEGRRDARLQPLYSMLDASTKGDGGVVPAGWTYESVRDDVEAGHTDDNREYLRENGTTPRNLVQAQAEVARRIKTDEHYALAGGFSAFAGQMAAGMMDPVGFALGLGVGKALHGVGIGSRALAQAGRSGAATTSFLAENALANISVEVMQDTLGEVKTTADYAMAGASGALLAAPFIKGALRTGQADAVRELVDDIKTRAVKEQVEKVEAVMRETGETDPVKVARMVEERELDDIMQDVKEATKPNQIRDQVVPEDVVRQQREELTGVLPEPEKVEVPVEPPPAAKIAEPEVAPVVADVEATGVSPIYAGLSEIAQTEGKKSGSIADARKAMQAYITENADAFADEAVAKAKRDEWGFNRAKNFYENGEDQNAIDYLAKFVDKGSVLGNDAFKQALKAKVTGKAAKVKPAREIKTRAGETIFLSFDTTGRKAPFKLGPNTYTTKNVLETLARIGNDTQGIAAYFLKALNSTVLDVPVRMDTRITRGMYNARHGDIAAMAKGAEPHDLAGTLGRMTEWEQQVLLHEITHAATVGKLHAYTVSPDKVPPALRKTMEQFHDLFERYKAQRQIMEGGPLSTQGKYATTNIREFAAELWTDPATRNILRGMEGRAVAGKPSSAWAELLDVIGRILGIKQDGLTEGARLLDAIMTAPEMAIQAYGRDGLPNKAVVNSPSPQQQAATTRRQAERLWQHAEQFMKRNPINVARLKVLTAKIGGMSDGLVLAASKNPVLQMVASLVTETTTGAAGRKANVAIRSHMLHKKTMGNVIPDYTTGFEAWNKTNGGGVWDSVMVGQKRREFDRLVYNELLDRRDANHVPHSDPNIAKAAQAVEDLFERARVEQINAGTLGANNLPGHSKGYVPQALDGGKLQELSVADLHLLHGELSAQFQNRLGWDAAFADAFAPYYTERIRKRAQGDKGIDGLSAGGDAGQVVRDTLADMALDPHMRDRAEAAQKVAAGLGHTKKRLDLDLRAQLRPGLQVADLYVTDPLTLARTYARRTSGNVALTESGILGIRGVRALRDAAGQPIQDGATPTLAELEAFDRVMAEILGTPVAGQVVSAGATNMGLLVGLQRLGGLVFTQSAETMQLVHHLGIRSLFSGVASLPQHLGDVGRIKKGLPPERHLLTSIEQYGGEIGMDSYKMVAPLDAPDARLEQYMEQSGVLTRLLRGGGHLQSKISGFRGLMAAQHRMAAEQILMKAARFIRDGGEDVSLRDMGFTKEVADSLKNDLDRVAKWDANGNLQSFDLTQVSDPRTAEAFVQAVHRGTSQIIQGVFIGEKNKWFHNDYLRLMLQLRTFGLTASEKQWGRTRMNHNYTYAAGMLLGQMAMVLPIHAARIQLASAGREDRDKYIKENMNPVALARATMNYSSLSGLMGDMMEVGSGVIAGWGDAGTKELLGARQQSSGVGRIIPVAGSIDAAVKVATGKANAYTAMKQLPFSSLWYLTPAINLAKEK